MGTEQFASGPPSSGELSIGSTGVAQFRRRWVCENPRASALIIHGYSEHSGCHENTGSALAASGFDTYSFDHYGFGRSGGRRGHVPSFEVYLDDIEVHMTRLRALGMPVVMFGHSMGGLLACYYVIKRAIQPDVLLLSGPALDAAVPTWKRTFAPLLGRIAPTLFVPETPEYAALSSDPEVQSRYELDELRVQGGTARFGQELFEAMDFTRTNVAQIELPTYVIHGGDDRVVPAEFSEPLATLPNVQREVLPGMQHEVLAEPGWEATLATLISFADQSQQPSS